MTPPDEDELAYFRAVEDQFAALRGTPFLFSPKDFALLRSWRDGGVPLAAVLAGIGEVWERRRERGGDPVSSLAYCRHAVARHARGLATARAGAPEPGTTVDVPATLRRLAAEVAAAAERWCAVPSVAAVLRDLERAIATFPSAGEPAALDETLASLEFAAVEALARSLPAPQRQALAADVDGQLAGLNLEGDVRARTRRALLAKAVRRTVGLPRLEVGAGAH